MHSQPGLGISFQVSLLLQSKETPQDEVLFPDLKVLVVDDDTMMCAYTLQMLRERGLQAEWVHHNPAAVEKIIETQQQGEDYDAVF